MHLTREPCQDGGRREARAGWFETTAHLRVSASSRCRSWTFSVRSRQLSARVATHPARMHSVSSASARLCP
eukprot:2542131-Prymnesium_polylepis.1